MAVSRPKNTIIDREKLRALAEVRLREAEALLEQGLHAGAMFLGGCALECYLKLAICHTLRLGGLPSIFKLHDLEALLLYTGFDATLRGESNKSIKQSFETILDGWKSDGRETLLYGDPGRLKEKNAKCFLASLRDPKIGVIPWLLEMMS